MPRPLPWTVMIKYKKTGRCFFLGGIRARTAEQAIEYVHTLGYCLTKGAFEIKALRVPILEFPKPKVEHSNVLINQPVGGTKVSSGVSIRTETGGK